jgi:hypothetical protein
MNMLKAVIASEAKQSIEPEQSWIASELTLLAMTGMDSGIREMSL